MSKSSVKRSGRSHHSGGACAERGSARDQDVRPALLPDLSSEEVAVRWEAALAAYSKKIRTAARNSDYVSPEHPREDMEQELFIVLFECVKLYNPARGASFNSFFWMRAKQRIGRLRSRAHTQRRSAVLVSLDEDAVAQVVNRTLAEESAEDYYLALATVRERASQQLPELVHYWREQQEHRASG